jgi:hypothetical protein
MGYSWHQKRALDSTLPLSHRYSHLRSCALSVSRLLGENRSTIIAAVLNQTGIDIEQGGDENQLVRALEWLTEMRSSVLNPDKSKPA